MSFTHLHVASSFSLRYGTTTPGALVERAEELGYSQLALTDRDGLYGAVKFVEACRGAGIAPIIGVDLALAGTTPQLRRSSPAKGGQAVDDGAPRVTVLARGAASGLRPGAGWAALCRLTTDAHLSGERHGAAISGERLVERVRSAEGVPRFTVLVGPASDVGEALRLQRFSLAERLLRQWCAMLPPGSLAVEVACHGGPPDAPASRAHAVALWRLARACDVPAVLTGWVRHARPEEAITADVLDAARRMVALHPRHLDRTTVAGYLRPEGEMLKVARDLSQALGDESAAVKLISATQRLAELCVQDPVRDIGIGAVHLPEPEILGLGDADPQEVLAQRCRSALADKYGQVGDNAYHRAAARLEEELRVIASLGYPTYFLTVGVVCDLIRDAGVRVAARGSGAGSIVNYLLGISGVDPMRYGLLMERFCTTMRVQLPDIDIDVESARRTEMYERIMERFGGERVTCVSMAETYRVRHAIRDAGAALGMAPADVDVIAKTFPHIAARDVRSAITELPELRARGLGEQHLDRLFDLVERLDGLPRHIAMHPCGVVLSNAQLGERTPMEASWLGFPMSQFDKDDVEVLGLLKLDVLGIRMQSAMAHAVAEIERIEGKSIDLDDRTHVPFDDEETFDLIRSTRTLGCFQIESPGQRELIGKLAPKEFEDLIIDISLFRPGPVKSDMINPFLRARHGWGEPEYLHETLRPALEETCGVVVFHEQVLRIVAETTGVSLAWADDVRRAMGTSQGQQRMEEWWRPAAQRRGYTSGERDRIWSVLAAFASFGFCKAHAAAFALPTYQSAWLKTHHPAAFLAGVLTHDPGMYPKRLMVSDARSFGLPIGGVDVNASQMEYRVERFGEELGVRVGLCDVKGMSEVEQRALVAGQPYAGLVDFWNRAQVSRPVAEKLVTIGAFDSIYGLIDGAPRGQLTRRDLLLELADLERWNSRTRTSSRRRMKSARPGVEDTLAAARFQAQGARPGRRSEDIAAQLVLELPQEEAPASGLPEFTAEERVRAELDVLGIDVSGHVMDFYRPLLDHLGLVEGAHLVDQRGGDEVWCAGIKVATQTPPVRSGRRVIFLTLDDGTNPVDATFFEDAQGPFADTVFHSWMLLVRGVIRRTGPRGVSLRASGAWDLSQLWAAWSAQGSQGIAEALSEGPAAYGLEPETPQKGRRVLVHPSGYRQSPYADIQPAGEAASGRRVLLPGEGEAPRALWHASPGSSGGWSR